MRGNILKRIAVVVVAVCVGVTFIPLTGEYDVFAAEGEKDTSVAAQDVSTGESGQQQGAESGDNNGLEASEDTGENGGESGDPGTQDPDAQDPGMDGTGSGDENGLGDGNQQDPPTEPEVKNGLVEEDGNWYFYENDNRMPGLITTEEGKVYYADPNTCVLQSGQQEIDGKYYYFDPSTFERKCGQKQIDGKYYYFNPERQSGLKKIDGKYYYFNPERQSGLKTINGARYYFDPKTFVMKTGVVKLNGSMYYFYKSGKAVAKKNAWFQGSDATVANRYALGNGKIAFGAKKITATVNGKKVTTLYYFDKTTGKKKAKGFFKDGTKRYYCKGNGKLAVKWNVINNKAYYFDPNTGVQAINKTVGYLKIPKCGYLGEAYVLGIKKLNSTKWTLKQAYKNSYKIRYQGRWWRQKTSELYAIKGFKKNKGNCYVMAATFYIQAKLLGYNVRQIKGKVAYRAPHSWTQIKNSKGKWRVYDPNFRNETGRNGWNIYYGKKGTWRYTNYSVFQK